MGGLGRTMARLWPLLRLAACCLAQGAPRRLTLAQRLANLPLDGAPLDAPVVMRWSERHVPHVAAQTERDLAVGIGVVHAHLRLAQMEVLRRIARGRLAEMVGAAAVALDHSLRVLDLTRSVPATLDAMAGPTRAWLDGFVAGVNHVVDRALPPPEFAVLGLAREQWSAGDVLAVGRLASWDVSWLALFAALRHAADPDFATLWPRLTGARTNDALANALGAAGHGSNAFAVAAGRSASDGALLAADPHLGLHLPGLWLAIAFEAPGLAAAGLMLPGLPFVAIGRNRQLAWGGTNLHALASELIDVTDTAGLTERTETIGVRWSRPRTIRVRESPFGPVVSDAPLVPAPPGRALALRWVGHRPSDELDAMLGLNRARDVPEARRALAGFAVPGQTFVLAAAGGVARVTAAHLPARPAGEAVAPITPAANAGGWDAFVTSDTLPTEVVDGFVVSANERPPPSPVRIGAFFSPPDRAERLARLLASRPRLTIDDLAAFQRDVHMATSAALNAVLVARGAALGGLGRRAKNVLKAMAGWDGDYTAESRGAAAFELVLGRFARDFLGPRRLAAYRAGWGWRRLLLEDLSGRDRVADALRRALNGASGRTPPVWGDIHRLRLRHPLGRVPLAGRRWPMVEAPSPGSDETVAKAANGPVTGKHAVTYGANARWLNDGADPDANFFVLLGGQDGWPGSDTMLDQVASWREGRLVRLPLTVAAARLAHPHETVLRPG